MSPQSQPASELSPVQAFKAFLSSRPVVKEILFKMTIFQEKPTRMERPGCIATIEHVVVMEKQSDGTYVKVSESPERDEMDVLCHGAWQKDQFFSRWLRNESEIAKLMVWEFGAPPKPFGGRVGNRVFLVNAGIIQNGDLLDKGNSATRGALAMEDPLNTVLNFGVWGTKLNSFQWNGNFFQTELGYDIDEAYSGPCFERKFDPSGKLISEREVSREELKAAQPPIAGELVVENGYPKELRISPRGIVCEYEYVQGGSLGNGIPNKITVIGPYGEVLNRYEIIKISTQTEELPASYFAPERFFDPAFIVQARVGQDGRILFDDPVMKQAYKEAQRQYLKSLSGRDAASD